ncbi:hypothetical protein NC652_022642, partial [Populus alba x Populus x berolinensis]
LSGTTGGPPLHLIHSLFLQIGTSGLLLPPPPNLSIYLTDCYFNTKQYNKAAPNHDQYPCTIEGAYIWQAILFIVQTSLEQSCGPSTHGCFS